MHQTLKTIIILNSLNVTGKVGASAVNKTRKDLVTFIGDFFSYYSGEYIMSKKSSNRVYLISLARYFGGGLEQI